MLCTASILLTKSSPWIPLGISRNKSAGGYLEILEAKDRYEKDSDGTAAIAKELFISPPSSGAEQTKKAEEDELNRPIGE
ncbi:hypothetical protein N7490_011576 [Penicillium lividum]|nr:hypothetical protein N7490_011576 [Penicillium lividum]